MDGDVIFVIYADVSQKCNFTYSLFKIVCAKCHNFYFDRISFFRHYKMQHLGWKKCLKCGAITQNLKTHKKYYCDDNGEARGKENKSIIYKNFLNRKRESSNENYLDKFLFEKKIISETEEEPKKDKNDNLFVDAKVKTKKIEIKEKKKSFLKKIKKKIRDNGNKNYKDAATQIYQEDFNLKYPSHPREQYSKIGNKNVVKKNLVDVGIQTNVDRKEKIEYVITSKNFSFEYEKQKITNEKNREKSSLALDSNSENS